MKKTIYLFITALSMLLFSCEKIETEGVSRITYYPDFTLTGGQYVRHLINTPYSELGVSALEGETVLEVKTQGTVDVTKEGVYAISYAATNKDGFDGAIDRYVIVTSVLDDSEIDFSGNYDLAKSSFVPLSTTMKKTELGYYDMGSLYGYEGAKGSEYKMPVKLVNLNANTVGLVPLVDIFGYSLTGTGSVQSTGEIIFTFYRDGTSKITRYWQKL